MKQHSHCHCHFKDQLAKFKAGKLGWLGGFLIIAHLMFHIAECLILPAAFVALHHHDAEAVTELTDDDSVEITFIARHVDFQTLKINFQESLDDYQLILAP